MRKPRAFRPDADPLEARWVPSHVGVKIMGAPAGLTHAEVRAERADAARAQRLALPHRVSGHLATTDPPARAHLSAAQAGANVTTLVGIPFFVVGLPTTGFAVTNGLGFRGLAVNNGLGVVTNLTALASNTGLSSVQFTQTTTRGFALFTSPNGLGLDNGLILTSSLGASFNIGLGLNNGVLLNNSLAGIFNNGLGLDSGLILSANVGVNNGLVLNTGVGLTNGVGSNPGVNMNNGLIFGGPILTGSAGLNNGLPVVV